MEKFIAMLPLTEEAFTTDSADVDTYLVNFVTGNETAEVKIQAHDKDNNEQLDTKDSRGH